MSRPKAQKSVNGQMELEPGPLGPPWGAETGRQVTTWKAHSSPRQRTYWSLRWTGEGPLGEGLAAARPCSTLIGQAG